MDTRHDKKIMKIEGDRLSSLPDELIHKILSSFSIKHVVQTSVLSSRWRFIWTSTPYLNFCSEEFSSMNTFMKAVTFVLCYRDNETEVTSLKLSLQQRISQTFTEGILDYAFSHNAQKMTISCVIEKKIEFPLSVFRSESLEHLTLAGFVIDHSTSTWALPSLTTLHLTNVTLYDEDEDDDDDCDYIDNDDILSDCVNLQNLTLDGCKINRLAGFGICLPQLTDLTLRNGYWGWSCVYVDAPELKNLTIVNCDSVNFFVPQLTSLKYTNDYSLVFTPDYWLPRLEAVNLCIRNPRKIDVGDIVSLLQRLHNVKFLTLNLEIIEALSSSAELISSKPSPYANLRSLRIYPVNIQLEAQSEKKVTVFNEVKSYLLDRSPSATFKMVTREEIRARNTTLAQHLMGELWVTLEKTKADMNWDRMGRSVVIDSEDVEFDWEEDVAVQRQYEKRKINGILSKLQEVVGLLKKLPTQERAKMQSCFTSLWEEVKLVIREIDSIKH